MHSHALKSDDVDSNLYPALLQVFTILIMGYVAGSLKIITEKQGTGLNLFVGTFILPALLVKNIATLDFSVVDWYFLASIFVSKSAVFILAIVITLITLRPMNIGQAAVFAVFVSQSNDFALGVPITDAIYQKSHPDYINYLYLFAPISLLVLNPIAFFFLELNEHWTKNKMIEEKKKKETDITGLVNKTYDNDDLIEIATTSNAESTNEILNEVPLQRVSSYVFTDTVIKNKKKLVKSDTISRKKLLKNTIWATLKNPIVFMTFFGLIMNVIFGQKIPALIEPVLTTLANSFSALALFYLGMNMVGKIRNLTFSMIIIILILVFTKGLVFPLMLREMIVLFEGFKTAKNASAVPLNSDLSTFGFLYGTFPSAPSLLVFIGKYKYVQHDLVSSALVFGTLASAPLMMVSGKMISIEYANHSSTNFNDIQCKTAFGFSFATWFCCIWVLYIFLASGRILVKPHRYTFFLILAQMLTSFVHIIWTSATSDSTDVSGFWSYTYVFFTLFSAFLTRCIPLVMLFNLISITKLHCYDYIKFNRYVLKVADSKLFLTFIGFLLPLFLAILCVAVGGFPAKQGMMIQLGKPQLIISIILLLYLIISITHCLILFARTKFQEESLISLVANSSTRYFSNYVHVNSARIRISNGSSSNGSNSDLENSTVSSLLVPEISDSIDEKKYSSSFQAIEKLNAQFQIMQHISLIVIFLFVSVICLFIQIWSLKGDFLESSIFFELQLIDTVLLYGQGFFVFIIFGLDNNFIFAPLFFKIKELLRLVKPLKLVSQSELPDATLEICNKFEDRYRAKCASALEKKQRFHYNLYEDVFSGEELIGWFIANKLVKTRKHGKNLGRKLIEGRVMHHTSFKRDFYDGFHLYKFYN